MYRWIHPHAHCLVCSSSSILCWCWGWPLPPAGSSPRFSLCLVRCYALSCAGPHCVLLALLAMDLVNGPSVGWLLRAGDGRWSSVLGVCFPLGGTLPMLCYESFRFSAGPGPGWSSALRWPTGPVRVGWMVWTLRLDSPPGHGSSGCFLWWVSWWCW